MDNLHLMFLNQSDVNVVKSDKGLVLEATKDFYATFKVRSLEIMLKF